MTGPLNRIEQVTDQLVTEQPDHAATTEVIQQVMPRTPAQVDRAHGAAGRHRYRRDNTR